MEGTCSLRCRGFVALTVSRDVTSPQISPHVWPVEIMTEASVQFFHPEMPEVIMCESEQLLSQVLVFWNHESIADEKESIL